MKPLRRKKKCKTTIDSVTGQERILRMNRDDDIYSDEGSIDSFSLEQTFFLECGCSADVAGRCHDCHALSCEKHHGICEHCKKPICQQHSHYITNKQDNIRLCGECLDKNRRKQRTTKIKNVFLSLFLDLEK